MEPMAVYNEVRFDGKRRFELLSDAIHIDGSVILQSRFDTTIPLKQIAPHLTRLHIRHNLFWVGLLICIVALVACTTLVTGFDFGLSELVPTLLCAIAFSGLALSLATVRKIEFVRFNSDSGVAIIDIACSGPDRDRFEAFVNQVLEQIRTCKQEDVTP